MAGSEINLLFYALHVLLLSFCERVSVYSNTIWELQIHICSTSELEGILGYIGYIILQPCP